LIHPAVSPQQTWAKIGGCAPFGGEELGLNLTQRGEAYLHAKFHFDPSNRLTTIHQRHRQTGQDRQTDRQWCDSIGRTVLQTVTQKSIKARIWTHENISPDKLIEPSLTITNQLLNHTNPPFHVILNGLRPIYSISAEAAYVTNQKCASRIFHSKTEYYDLPTNPQKNVQIVQRT